MSSASKLLIVDDDTSMTELLSDFLVEKGYDVEVALNAGDALMLATLSRPDAVILDLRLGDASGADVLTRLRALDPSLAVVMLSGADDEEVARALLREGAVDYVRKPFELQTLERAMAIATAVGRRGRPGTVVPFRAVRHVQADERARCASCTEPLLDLTRVVVERRQSFHAPCWLQARHGHRVAVPDAD